MLSEEYRNTMEICNRVVDLAQKLYGWNREQRGLVYKTCLNYVAEDLKDKSPEIKFQVIIQSLLNRIIEDIPNLVLSEDYTHNKWVV
jgi:hypothetical protein